MNVRIASGDRPVRAHGTPLSPIGLLPASDNAKLSASHPARSLQPGAA